MAIIPPINLKSWVDENRASLKPPVGNKVIYEDSDWIIMVVGGPNTRSDFHINTTEEFFYQIEGDISLKVREGSEIREIPIREGEIFLLPGNIPHSPQRPADTVGLVIERKREKGQLDGFVWYCEGCNEKLYSEYLHLTDIVKQLPPLFTRFYSGKLSTCKHCGKEHKRENK